MLVVDAYPREFRDMVVATPGLEHGIAGVVLPMDAVRHRSAGLRALGVHTGITADTGAAPLAGCPGESITEGLDGMSDRLRRAALAGASFARWRSRVTVDHGRPTVAAIRANGQALARFAAAAQEVGLVPVIDTRVGAGGSQPMSTVECVVGLVLLEMLSELTQFNVDLGGLVLAASPVRPGPDCLAPVTPRDVAAATVGTLANVVPRSLGGLAIVDCGHSMGTVLADLAALGRRPVPWPFTFCFGPALLGPALAAWSSAPIADRVMRGQRALGERLATAAAALAGVDELERLDRPAR